MGRSFRKRWTLGEEVWECDQCHSVNISGKPCKCGRTHGIQLAEQAKHNKHNEPKKEHRRLREPASEGTFIKSYYFPTDKETEK